MSVSIDFSKYHRYDELVRHMRDLTEAYPGISRMYSIGKSYEGRDIWLVEITNPETGDHGDKPGLYIDANHHAGEVTGTACALYTIHYLLTRYGTDEEVTRLVDTVSFYIVPRVSPDGAEFYLTTPYTPRSSVRHYPHLEEQDGFHEEDIDGNGEILEMRVPDPDGEWKVSDKDPRLMVPRLPNEYGGQYYRLYPEGLIRGYDGAEFQEAPGRWGLDFNRQFPLQWKTEAFQKGAGPYPLSEPEPRAVAEFLMKQKNITGGQSYHTTGGLILRPSSYQTDSKMDTKDRAAFSSIGKMGEELTGYPCVSIFDGFKYEEQTTVNGCFFDWCYEHLGLLLYSTELWDLRVRAGLERLPNNTPLKDRDLEAEGLAMLAWNDRELGGEGFAAWQDFDHPQLGRVQVGGWRMKGVHQNAPARFLEEEAHKNTMFTLKHAGSLPRVEIVKTSAEPLGDGVFRISVTVGNRGYLPTQITEMAKKIKTAQSVTVELSLPAGAELIAGNEKEELGHLEGRVVSGVGYYPGYFSATKEKRAEWIVRGSGEIAVTASSEKAGRHAAALALNKH